MAEDETTLSIPGTRRRREKTIFEVNREQAQRLYAELDPERPAIAGRVEDLLEEQGRDTFARAMGKLEAIAVSFPKIRLNELAHTPFFDKTPYQAFIGGGKHMRAFFFQGHIPESPQHRILGSILEEQKTGECLCVATAVTEAGEISTFYRRYHGQYPKDAKGIDQEQWDDHYELKPVPWEGPQVSGNIQNLFKILDSQAEAQSPAPTIPSRT